MSIIKKIKLAKIITIFLMVISAGLIQNRTALIVNAAPKTMSDGGTFDAEYYASHNPDVVAAVGNNEEALYNHYLQFGKKEGRIPYSDINDSTKVSAQSTSIQYVEAVYNAMVNEDENALDSVCWIIKNNYSNFTNDISRYLLFAHDNVRAGYSGPYYYLIPTSYGKVGFCSYVYTNEDDFEYTFLFGKANSADDSAFNKTPSGAKYIKYGVNKFLSTDYYTVWHGAISDYSRHNSGGQVSWTTQLNGQNSINQNTTLSSFSTMYDWW